MDYVNVAGTPKRALILTGDRLVGRNLGLQIPGFGGGAKLSTGNVDTKVIDGPVKIVATGLTATPAVRDVRTIPVTVNLDADINSVLDQLGVPDRHPVPNMEIPDMLMKEISLTGVTMEMVALYGRTSTRRRCASRFPKQGGLSGFVGPGSCCHVLDIVGGAGRVFLLWCVSCG